MSKLDALRTVALALVLGAAANVGSARAQIDPATPAGCLVAVAVAPGHLPRAHLAIENRRAAGIRAWLEGRAGSGLPRTELGWIGPIERRVFAHALPAGRNVLSADVAGSEGVALRQVVLVNNRGRETCARRYLWRVE